MDRNWILKILSGVHVGAEVVLSTAELVLGQNESCDLMLDDVSLSDRHISLRMDGEQALLTLLDTARPIYIGEQKLERGELILEPFQLISIGTLFMVVGPADAEWPAIDLQLKQKMTALPDHEEPVAVEEETDDVETAPVIAERSSRLIWIISAGVPLMVLLIVFTAWLLTPNVSAPTAEEIKIKVQQIATYYGAIIEVEQKHEGDIHITGYIGTEGKRQAFLVELENSGIVAEANLISSQQVANSLTLILDNEVNRVGVNRVDVAMVPGSPGDFTVEGYVGDAELWKNILAKLQRQMDYRSISDEVQTMADRIAALQDMLLAAGLEDVEIKSSHQELLVLPSKTETGTNQRLTEVIKTFNQQFASRPLLTTPKEDPRPEASSLKLDIRGITFGDAPHITMSNNKRHSEGSRLENGYVIKSITQEYILLQKSGESYYYYLNKTQ